jgi:hypothetical protein
MKSALLPLTLATAIALALGACNADRSASPATASEATPAVPADATPARPVPVAPGLPGATTNPGATPGALPGDAHVPVPGDGLARYDGYGDMRFGMTEAEALAAWGGALNGKADEGCHYRNPVWAKAPSNFGFMFDGGRFVRYDVGNDTEVAPGGGRRGMTEAQVDAAYPGRVSKSPHKYVDGGKYLRIEAPDGSAGALVFETDAAGKVTEWHAGLAPQVDWIEGCS